MEYDDSWDKNKNGSLKATYRNTYNFLIQHTDFIKYNTMTNEVEIVDLPPWDDQQTYPRRFNADLDSLLIKKHLYHKRYEPTIVQIIEAVQAVATENRFDPLINYIKSLDWDRIPRCNSWLSDYCGAERSDYTAYVGELFLRAAVKRAMHPGCKWDHMVIFEGEQGIGKSTVVKTLGGQFFKEESLLKTEKDVSHKLQGGWFIEVAELAAFSKKDIDSLKAFITRQDDEERFSYRRDFTKYPRRFVLVGTINADQSGYFYDNTGNRRFLPIKLNKVNIPGLESVRDQLFAEAYYLLKQNESIYIPDSAIAIAIREEQNEREVTDEWMETIKLYIKNHSERYICCMDVFVGALDGRAIEIDQRISRRIANCLVRLGAVRVPHSMRVGDRVGKFFDTSTINKIAWTE